MTRMQNNTADTRFMHRLDLAFQLRLRELMIQEPERRGR